MTYEEVVNFLYAQLPVFHREGKKAFKPGLGNIQELAAQIGNPQQHFKSLHNRDIGLVYTHHHI
jgi:dihydrofolate synthase / folylpolyglutamate synthase